MKTYRIELKVDGPERHNLWFSADPHFGHHNIIPFCGRPFSSAQEMDDTIINNYNEDVRPEDTLIIIGDFAGRYVRKYRALINCNNIWLIEGNHDKDFPRITGPYERPTGKESDNRISKMPVFQKIETLCGIDVVGPNIDQYIVLCHYAMRCWHKSHRGSYQLYGHTHAKMVDDPSLLSIDVGVDAHNFRAISFEKVAEIMNERKKSWKPDHIRWAEARGEKPIIFDRKPKNNQTKTENQEEI